MRRRLIAGARFRCMALGISIHWHWEAQSSTVLPILPGSFALVIICFLIFCLHCGIRSNLTSYCWSMSPIRRTETPCRPRFSGRICTNQLILSFIKACVQNRRPSYSGYFWPRDNYYSLGKRKQKLAHQRSRDWSCSLKNGIWANS